MSLNNRSLGSNCQRKAVKANAGKGFGAPQDHYTTKNTNTTAEYRSIYADLLEQASDQEILDLCEQVGWSYAALLKLTINCNQYVKRCYEDNPATRRGIHTACSVILDRGLKLVGGSAS